MENDNEQFLRDMQVGATVTAKAETDIPAGTVIPELSTKGTGFGDITAQTPLGTGSRPVDPNMNVDAPQELIDAPVDATIDIIGNSGSNDNAQFLRDMGLSKPAEPKMTMQEYAKTLDPNMSYEDRTEAIREYRRANIDSTTSASITGGDAAASDFSKGIAGSMLGSAQFFLDVLDGIGFEPTGKISQENLAKIQHIKSMVQDDSLFSAYGMGQAIYSLSTLPIAPRRLATLALAEAYMGYSISRGSGAEVSSAITSGLAAGTLTYGVGKLLNNIGGVTALEAIEGSVGRKMDLPSVYSSFAKVTNRNVEDLTNHDKVLAIASAGGKDTAQVFAEMARRNRADGIAIDDYLQKPTSAINESIAANSLATTKKVLSNQIAFAKSAYNELENLAMMYPTANINLGPAKQSIIDNILDSTNEITRSPKLNKALNTLQKENINLEELLDLRKDLNGVKFKAQNLNTKTKNEVDAVNYIDSVIDANLPAEFSPAFKALREELKMAYSFAGKQKKAEYKNKVAELVTKIDSGEETAIAVLQKLVKASGGPNKFNQIHSGIGTAEMVNFEKALVKEIMAAKGDKLAEVIQATNKLGFVTPEAQALVKNIQELDKVFSSADFYRATLNEIHHGVLDGTSITNDVTTKFSYMATAGVWKTIMPYLDPISQSARSEREFRRIVESIRKGIKADTSKTKLDGPTEEMYSQFRPIIRESIVNTIQDTLNTIKGMSAAKIPEGPAGNLLDAPANFTVSPDGTAIRQTGDAAQEALNREPINTTIVDEANVPSTTVKPDEEIIDVEWWHPTSTVVTPDGHVLSMEDLLRGKSLPDNLRLPEKASKPIQNFFDMQLKLKTDPDLIKAREEVKKAKDTPAKEKAKGRLAQLIEYQRLRDQGMKPADAHKRVVQASSEVSGALLGGTMNGVTIDDAGNLQIDPEAFLIGAAGGAAVVKGGKSLGKYLADKEQVARDLSMVYKNMTKGEKMRLVKHMLEPKFNIVADAYTPDVPELKRFEIAMEKAPKAISDGNYEKAELWSKGKFFIDWDGETRRWIDVDVDKLKSVPSSLTKVTSLMPKHVQDAVPDLSTMAKSGQLESGAQGEYMPIIDILAISNPDAKHVLLHEAQHAIQGLHNMQSGINPGAFLNSDIRHKYDSLEDAYMHNLGEIYARYSEEGKLKDSPFLRAINEYGLNINVKASAGPRLLFGDIRDTVIESKLKNGTVEYSDLPKIRGLIQEASENYRLANAKKPSILEGNKDKTSPTVEDPATTIVAGDADIYYTDLIDIGLDKTNASLVYSYAGEDIELFMSALKQQGVPADILGKVNRYFIKTLQNANK